MLSIIAFSKVNLCPTVLFGQIGFVCKDPAATIKFNVPLLRTGETNMEGRCQHRAKATARSIGSLFITMSHLYVTQIGEENRSEKYLLLAEYFHVKSVLTDPFPQTDGPTYGRYWPSSHSRHGLCVYLCLIFAPSSGCSIVLTRTPTEAL